MSLSTAQSESYQPSRLSPAEDLRSYWQELFEVAEKAPCRKNFSPANLSATTLRQVALFEVDDHAGLHKRLLGSTLEQLYGASFGAEGPFKTESGFMRSQIRSFVDHIRSGDYWGRLVRPARQNGLQDVNTTTTVFPLCGKSGAVEYLVCVIEVDIGAYQNLGLGLTVTHDDIAQTVPQSLTVYSVYDQNDAGEDLIRTSSQSLARDHWTNAPSVS